MAVPDIVSEVIAFHKAVMAAEHAQRASEKEDLGFQVPEGAWPDDVKASRASVTVKGVPIPPRPMLSIDTLSEPISLQFAQAQNAHLGVNIHPLTEDASDDTAEVLQGLYRSIEISSRANIARLWGHDRALKAGRGNYRVDKEYDRSTGVPGDQKLVINRNLYQSQIFLDPFAIQPDWSDGERALEVEDLPWPVYKRRYKKSKLAGYTDEGLTQLVTEDDAALSWVGGEEPENRTIRVGKYWYVEHVTEDVTLPGGGENGADYTYEDDRRVLHCVIVNRVEQLTEYKWEGVYIPLIPNIGRELQPFDGKRRWIGMIANAKDGVRLTNYAASGAVEMAALEPKAPFDLDPKQIEGYETFWQQANTRNFPYLPRHQFVDGQSFERPARMQVDTSRLGPNMQLLSMGRDFVQSATATYDPALGKQPTAHRSGRALVALQDQTVEATSGYLSNLAEISMTYEAMVILDLIPHVYDRPGRVVQILDGEDRKQTVMLNHPYEPDPVTGRPRKLPYGTPEEKIATDAMVANPKHPAKHYDLNKGRYGVSVTIGKSYKTRLEQGNDQMGQLLQAEPSWLPILGPNWIRYQDWPGHREAADMLKKVRDHQFPYLADDPQAQQMDPQRLAAENQQLKQQLHAAGMAIETKQIEQQGKLQITQVQEAAETARADKDREAKLAVAALQGKFETMQNAMQLLQEEIARIGSQQHDAGQAAADRAHEAAMASGDHQAALQQGDQAHQQTMAQADQQHGQALVQNQQQADLQPPPVQPNGSGGA